MKEKTGVVLIRSVRYWDDLHRSRWTPRIVFLQMCQEVVPDLLMVSWVLSKLLPTTAHIQLLVKDCYRQDQRKNYSRKQCSTCPKQTTARVVGVAICRRRSEDFHP